MLMWLFAFFECTSDRYRFHVLGKIFHRTVNPDTNFHFHIFFILTECYVDCQKSCSKPKGSGLTWYMMNYMISASNDLKVWLPV